MKPIIAINGASAFDRQFFTKGKVAFKAYPQAVAAAGGVPLMVPSIHSVDDYAWLADGLLLTGSLSFAPAPAYTPLVNKMEEKERPIFDSALVLAFAKAKKPIMGVCLGLQCINLTFGGTLKNHFKLEDGVEHMLTAHPCIAGTESIAGKLFGKEFIINSRHERRIDTLAPGLEATAWSPDGVIEEIKHESLPIWAFEWHPERMRGDDRDPPEGPDTTPLFKWFVNTCAAVRDAE